MQSKIVITDSNRYEEIINELEASSERIRNIIEKEKKNVERINETDTWSGTCAKSMYNKYKELNSNYSLIEYSLEIYNKFLRKTLEDYRRIEEELNKNMEEMASNLDVNG